ncbi:vanadium-dependent haloperoxidase [Povalibacter sp.]|uniref:vanadium-dependent haloperoxidase n=1 Tax=Povalibacter sp. TaxID=1962978 RepID=UPI002F42BE4D
MTTLGRLTGMIATLSLGAWSAAHADVVTEWNAVTMNCVQGPVTPANRTGPTGLLDIAIVQAAVHDAVQAIDGRYEPYHFEAPALRGSGSRAAAAASAAYGVLRGLYGADDPCLVNVVDPASTYAGDGGLLAGAQAAAALLPLYRPAFILPTDPFVGGTDPGEWRPTPGVTQGAATFMAETAPFAMKRPSQFRPAPPPKLRSSRYLRDYQEVKAIGSLDNTRRTAKQTDVSRFWSVNFFNQWFEAVRNIADQRVADLGEKARLFALVSFAAADSQISIYETKYLYNYWRPITAIQEGDRDGNPWTRGDASWTPFITTPPYPDYSSGANCLTASIVTVLQRFFRTDKLAFSVRTTAAGVKVNPRTYKRFSDVMDEMVEVRIWQGIHFRTAEVVGRRQGAKIGHWTFDNYLGPVRRRK